MVHPTVVYWLISEKRLSTLFKDYPHSATTWVIAKTNYTRWKKEDMKNTYCLILVGLWSWCCHCPQRPWLGWPRNSAYYYYYYYYYTRGDVKELFPQKAPDSSAEELYQTLKEQLSWTLLEHRNRRKSSKFFLWSEHSIDTKTCQRKQHTHTSTLDTSLIYLKKILKLYWASLGAQRVKNLPAMQVRPLGWEDLLEKGMATHSNILA